MSTKREGVLWGLVVVSIAISIYTMVSSSTTSDTAKTGYVDIPVMFDQFEMKKELQQKMESDLAGKQAVLDSLMFQLQSLNNQLESVEKPEEQDILRFQNLQQYYMQQKQMVDAYAGEQTQKYDQQIFEQMNQYVKDFGVKNGYSYVFGANNNGSILYAPEPNDITKEVIEFINKSYQGKN